MNLKQIKNIFEQEKGKSELLNSQVNELKVDLKNLKKEIKTSKKAGVIIRTVAQETQKLIECHISELVTLALRSIFINPYTFHLEFIQKRNKTECYFFFERDKHKINPFLEAGGGVIDVASFALRVAIWVLSKPKYRNVLIFDEPFKNINDKTRETHRRVAKIVKMLSDKLQVQFIVITMIPELEEVANKTFELELKNKVTKILNIGGVK